MESLKNEISLYKQLNNIYQAKFNIFSHVQSNIKPITTFSGNGKVKLPFKIKGRLITSGTYKDNELGEFTLPYEELQRTMDKWVGVKIFSSHRIFQEIMGGKDPSIRDVLGKITLTEWNDEDNGIDFYADILDEDIARKINGGLINSISAGFSREISTEMISGKQENYLRSIEPGEASMVFNPRDSKAIFKPI